MAAGLGRRGLKSETRRCSGEGESASAGMFRGGNGGASFGAELLAEGQIIDGKRLVHHRSWNRDRDAHSNDAASHRGLAPDEDVLGWNRGDGHSAVGYDGWTASLNEFHFDLLRVLLLEHREAHILVGQAVGRAELKDKRSCHWLSQQAFAGNWNLRSVCQLDVDRISETQVHDVDATSSIPCFQQADAKVRVAGNRDALGWIKIHDPGFVWNETGGNGTNDRTISWGGVEQIRNVGVDAVFIIRWHSLDELGFQAEAGGDEGDGSGDEFHSSSLVDWIFDFGE